VNWRTASCASCCVTRMLRHQDAVSPGCCVTRMPCLAVHEHAGLLSVVGTMPCFRAVCRCSGACVVQFVSYSCCCATMISRGLRGALAGLQQSLSACLRTEPHFMCLLRAYLFLMLGHQDVLESCAVLSLSAEHWQCGCQLPRQQLMGPSSGFVPSEPSTSDHVPSKFWKACDLLV